MKKAVILFLVSQISFVFANQEEKDKDKIYEHLRVFSDVLHAIEKSYVREVSTEKLIQGAIKGMIKELDPHSHFLPAKQVKVLQKESEGQFRGLGMELEMKDKHPIVISVLEDSPAHKAGLQPGQIILKINNKKTDGLNKMEISQLMKKRKGKKFNILVKDPISNKNREVRVKADLVFFKSVSHKVLEDRLLYIRINIFTERTSREIIKVMDKNKKPAGLILDLRGNPGGLLESAIKVANLFIKEGTIVHIKGRMEEYEQMFQAHFANTVADFPMIVLIDNYSASAAEILAGALKEHKRAVLLGRKSFGKGSVQSLIPLAQNNAVKLTVAHYHTPDGNSIHKKGIEPHLKLKAPVSSNESKPVQLTGKEDTDFHQALSFLKMFRHFRLKDSSSYDSLMKGKDLKSFLH